MSYRGLGALSSSGHGVIRTSDGWSYPLTANDVLWAGRMIAGEGGAGDSPAVLWTMTQLFTPAGQREKYGNPNRFTSFASLVQAYSQPINPIWRRDGSKCRPGGRYHRTAHCSESKLARRDACSSLTLVSFAGGLCPWTAEKRDILERWASGQLANPVPGAIEFAAPNVTRNWAAAAPGRSVGYRLGNWFGVTNRTAAWPDDYVVIEGPAGRAGDQSGAKSRRGGVDRERLAVGLTSALAIGAVVVGGYFLWRSRRR